MKDGSYRYVINGPRSRHGHRCSKVSQYDDAHMYEATPKQHLKLNSWKS